MAPLTLGMCLLCSVYGVWHLFSMLFMSIAIIVYPASIMIVKASPGDICQEGCIAAV